MTGITDKQFKNLVVETQDGIPIGRVLGFVCDPDSQTIIQYEVKPKQVVKGIVEGNLLIHRNQVIELTDKKMIVDTTSISSDLPLSVLAS